MIYTLVGALLFVIGLHGLFARRHLVMRIMSANIAAAGTFLVILAASGLSGSGRGASVADPVAQAIVLTGIVIAVSVTAFALSLVSRLDRGRPPEPRHGGH